MANFETKQLSVERDAVAADGSDVRILLEVNGGGMAHFELGPNQTSNAVTHRSVEEICFFLSGQGQMWREQNGESELIDVFPGVCLTIPLGTHFQFRSFGQEVLAAIGATIPPWQGDDEVLDVDGLWESTLLSDGDGPATRSQAGSTVAL